MRYLESAEQIELFARAEKRPYKGGLLRDFIYAVPNAGIRGGRRGLKSGIRRKKEGVTAGVPDIECFVAIPPYTGLHIEMKRKDGVPSDVSEAQEKMIKRLQKAGRKVVVAFGADHGWQALCQYLGIPA